MSLYDMLIRFYDMAMNPSAFLSEHVTAGWLSIIYHCNDGKSTNTTVRVVMSIKVQALFSLLAWHCF